MAQAVYAAQGRLAGPLASRPAMLAALGSFVLFEAVGLAAAPLAGLLLGRLPGAGLGLSKPLGLLLVTWLIWIVASLGAAPYGVALIAVALALLVGAGALAGARLRRLGDRLAAVREPR